MSAKRFRCLSDFMRWGQHIHLTCRNGQCAHTGVVSAWEAHTWFRLHRWPEGLEDCFGSSALDRFRCSRCGDRPISAKPTENAVTVTDFFPADEKGWKMLQRRLRG